jgi:anti-sigma regulatory factor (Ser/Thr protein kinase)
VRIDTDLPFATCSVADGRRLVAAALQAEGIAPSLRDDLVLASAELLTNALRHGRPRADGTIGLRVSVTADDVEVAVADGGTGPTFGALAPSPGDRSVTDRSSEPTPGGYGLLIVSALGELRVERGPTGTLVRIRMNFAESVGSAGTDGLLSLP